MSKNREAKTVTRAETYGISISLLKAYYSEVVNIAELEKLSDADLMNLGQLIQAVIWTRPSSCTLPEDRPGVRP